MPSEILRIKDEYTAFCFDEACIFLVDAIKNDKKLKFKDDKDKTAEKKDRKTFVQMALEKRKKDNR